VRGDITLDEIQGKSLFVGELLCVNYFVLKMFSNESILSEMLILNQEIFLYLVFSCLHDLCESCAGMSVNALYARWGKRKNF
jgi:hypothetical protein